MDDMRLWSLHPRYLDACGLVAVWREGLLARRVLQGGTRGYRHHPQLLRFRSQGNPLAAVDAYLDVLLEEAMRRGYNFDGSKIRRGLQAGCIEVTEGQLLYEWGHLLGKLERRDFPRYQRYKDQATPEAHPLFVAVKGDIAAWEKQAPGAEHG